MINTVRVYLEENFCEYTNDRIQCSFIVSEDECGKENIHHDLVDTSGYKSLKELVREIAAIFGVSTELIVVA